MSPAGNRVLRIVVADDQTAVREGLVTLLGLLPNLIVVASAQDGDEAVALAKEHRADVVLMDLRMPGCDGVEATRRIHEEQLATEVVVLTTHADDASIIEALAAGARGYLTKDAGRAEIGLAVQAAAAGQTMLDPAAQRALLNAAIRSRDPSPPAVLPDGLTPREGEVLRLIAAGHSNPQIAKALFVSEATVKSHINHIFSKTGVNDRAQAVHYAYQHGLVASAHAGP